MLFLCVFGGLWEGKGAPPKPVATPGRPGLPPWWLTPGGRVHCPGYLGWKHLGQHCHPVCGDQRKWTAGAQHPSHFQDSSSPRPAVQSWGLRAVLVREASSAPGTLLPVSHSAMDALESVPDAGREPLWVQDHPVQHLSMYVCLQMLNVHTIRVP